MTGLYLAARLVCALGTAAAVGGLAWMLLAAGSRRA